MAKTDGGTKVIHTIPAGYPAVDLVEALNKSQFGTAQAAVGFTFGTLVQPDGSTAIPVLRHKAGMLGSAGARSKR